MNEFKFIPGQQLYKYNLQKPIGCGGFSQVWLARDESLNKDIALKIIEPSNTSISKQLKEAVVGNRMEHANLVRVHYADVLKNGDIDVVLLAMDYQHNGCITNKTNSLKFIDLNDAIRAIMDTLRGLEYLHDNNVLHNDIKPSNIMVGDNNAFLLSDYGISVNISDNGFIKSDEQYHPHISPESLSNGIVTVKTDIYQVGLTLFRLINGINLISELPCRCSQTEFIELVKSGTIVGDNDWKHFVPNSVKRIVKKAVHIDPCCRYCTALEMRRDLEKLNYPGKWELDVNDKFIGYLKNNTYTYDIAPQDSKESNFIAYKRNNDSERTTKISKFCLSGLTPTKLVSAKKKFMTAVVEGKI